MNVFVETNFVLELALEQQEAPSCLALLTLAEERKIQLLLPAYSLIEPHEKLTRRRLERNELRSRIAFELKQIERSTPLTERVRASQEVVALLVESSEYEAKRIEEVKRRIWATAEVLPIDVTVLRVAAAAQIGFDLTPQDAVVYAAINKRLKAEHSGRSCFISRNPRDFDDPDLRHRLESLNCKYFSSFATALPYVEHEVRLP